MMKTILVGVRAPLPHERGSGEVIDEGDSSDPVERVPNAPQTPGSCRDRGRAAGRATHGRSGGGDPDPGDAPARAERLSKSAAADTRAAIANGDIPAQDEVVHSDNIEHLANIPKDVLPGINSDLAFQGKYAFAGNYDGFRIFDISNPKAPKTVAQVLCPGSQNDISVSGDLLFLSTDSSRSDNSCASTTQPATEKSSWRA